VKTPPLGQSGLAQGCHTSRPGGQKLGLLLFPFPEKHKGAEASPFTPGFPFTPIQGLQVSAVDINPME